MSHAYAQLLDPITRLKDVRGAMIVSGSDGVVVAESLMEDVKGNVLAALAGSLTARIAGVTGGAGRGTPKFLQLQAADGAMFVAPGGSDLLVVVVAGRDVPTGLARLEMLRAAARLG